MTDPRYQAAQAKLRRFLPPPPPDSGWGYARQRIEAQFLGVLTDDQAANGEAMMLMPAVLQRSDATPTDWTTNPYAWAFTAASTTYAGAQGEWLDLWGTILAVPRETSEPDGIYGPRILAEILRPTTTNVGLAQAIDEGLGIVGSQVVEAASVLTVYRLNDMQVRCNASTSIITKRLNMAGPFGGNQLWCCFVVRLPTGAQQPYGQATVQRIVDRRKAAGTRLLGIYTSGGGAISTPNAVTVGISTTASITPIAGATYLWSIVDGVIESGQGTDLIQWHATAEGQVGISLTTTLAAGTTNYWKPVQAYNAITSAITTGTYQYAGAFNIPASIAGPGIGFTISWAAVGLAIIGPTDQSSISFDVGSAGTLATLTVTLTNAAGASGSNTAQIKVVPYTSALTAATGILAPNQEQDMSLNLGWAYDLVSVQVDRPAWVRIYNTAAARTADATRPIISDPAPALADLVWEGIFNASTLTILDNPNSNGVNGDSPRTQTAYLSVINLDTTTAPVNVTITRTETRTSGTF